MNFVLTNVFNKQYLYNVNTLPNSLVRYIYGKLMRVVKLRASYTAGVKRQQFELRTGLAVVIGTACGFENRITAKTAKKKGPKICVFGTACQSNCGFGTASQNRMRNQLRFWMQFLNR